MKVNQKYDSIRKDVNTRELLSVNAAHVRDSSDSFK